MAYFECKSMQMIDPILDKNQRKIVPVFHDETTFIANEDQRFCRLESGEQLSKPKSPGRGLMVSEFVCPCHGRMVSPVSKEPCRVMIKYGKNYDRYWTAVYVEKQLVATQETFLQLHPDCQALYILDNSANHHKVAADA